MIEPMIVTFPAPDKYLNMNQDMHWGAKKRLVKEWRTAARDACLLSSRAGMPPSTVELTLPVPDVRRRDPMNYTPTMKACVDGLVDAGVWPDDDARWVTTLEPVLVLERRKRGEVPWVRLVITPREAS